MLLEGALGANGRADFEAREIADDGDAAKIAMLLRHDHDRDRVAVLVVDEQDLIEDALERLGRLYSLCHKQRITRPARRVQFAATRASTGTLAIRSPLGVLAIYTACCGLAILELI